MHGVNFSPDGARVYVSNESQSTLDVFDRKSGKLIKQVPLSNRPNNIAVAKDGRIVVGIARGEGALDIIDPATLTLKKTIPVHGRLHNVYVTPDGKYVITGSIRNSHADRDRPRHRAGRLGGQDERRRAADGDRGQPGRLDQAHLRAALRPQRLRGGGFRRNARKSPASSCRSPTATSRPTAGATPRRRTASASRRTTRRCGSPAFRTTRCTSIRSTRPEDGRPGRAAGAEAARPRRDLGGGELGHHHAGRQDALCVERRARARSPRSTSPR